MTEFTKTHLRVSDIELAAKAVSEYGSQFRWTPGFRACDGERAIRLKRFYEAVAELREIIDLHPIPNVSDTPFGHEYGEGVKLSEIMKAFEPEVKP